MTKTEEAIGWAAAGFIPAASLLYGFGIDQPNPVRWVVIYAGAIVALACYSLMLIRRA